MLSQGAYPYLIEVATLPHKHLGYSPQARSPGEEKEWEHMQGGAWNLPCEEYQRVHPGWVQAEVVGTENVSQVEEHSLALETSGSQKRRLMIMQERSGQIAALCD